MVNASLINKEFNEAFQDAQRVKDVRDIAHNYAGMIGSYEALILSLVRDEDDVEKVMSAIGRLRQRLAFTSL